MNALGDKSLHNRSANSCFLKTYDLILDILLSQYKLNLNHDVFWHEHMICYHMSKVPSAYFGSMTYMDIQRCLPLLIWMKAYVECLTLYL
jgi:hypothetical protein